MKSIISFFFAVTISLPLWAEEQAQLSLNTLSQSIKSLNFSSSFVVVKNNQAEPYHWFHGISEQGEQLEIWSLLNGPRRDTLRKGDVVSYIEPEIPPYSIVSTDLKGPIPSVFYKDFSVLNNSYDFISVGRSRVLGRTAQLVRIVSKDAHRYGHWVWLDQESGLLLKLAIASRSGQLLEQIQFTHLDISEKPAESLVQLQSTELPKALEVPENYQQPSVAWTVNWLPSGFERLSTNRHRITVTKQPVEFMLFSEFPTNSGTIIIK